MIAERRRTELQAPCLVSAFLCRADAFFSAEKQFPLDQQESATDLRLDYNKFNYHFLFIWLVYGRARYHCREIGQLKGETFNVQRGRCGILGICRRAAVAGD